MDKKEILVKIYSKIDELPTLPAVLSKLLSMMENEMTDASDIANILSRDPAMASKILKVANSAYYGFSQGITSMEKAVPLLGFNMVKSLALSIGVVSNLSSAEESPGFSRKGLWIHSLATATAMREMENRFENRSENEHLFILGLLHDVGKIVLDQFFFELFQEALQEANKAGEDELYILERKIIGLDHGEVGAMLLSRWKFPEVISNAIAAHHQAEIPEGTNVKDVAMLRVADLMSQELEMETEGNPVTPEPNETDLEILNMK